jgi:glycosyltransferase involved in cell wall biosynthesis
MIASLISAPWQQAAIASSIARATAAAVAKVLYITYDGLTDPLGRSQILPYLQGCASKGHGITVLSCEKPERLQSSGETVQGLCHTAGIEWRPLKYHKRPPVASTAFDAVMLSRTAARLHRSRRFDLVHCRSHISAIAGLRLKRRDAVPLLFDMRGFWPEERTEGGSWNLHSPIYRGVYNYFKRLESGLLRRSDHIVSLTEAAKQQLLSRPECEGAEDRISVIPCCVDFDHFPPAERMRRDSRARLGIDSAAPVLGYLGSLGGNYMLDEMLDFFRVFRRSHPAALFLFVTLDDPHFIRETARRRGVDPEHVLVHPATREEVPAAIAAADFGIAFKQPSFSALACSPTKLGEMLAIGIPVVANVGVGDVESILASTRSGAVVRRFEEASYSQAVSELERIGADAEGIRDRSRPLYDLTAAVDRYAGIYEELGAGASSAPVRADS